MYQRMAAMAAFSCLILATPALARDRHKTDGEPCDTVGAFDSDQELVAFRASGPDYFEDQKAKPAEQQAAPDADADDGDSADDPDADSDDDDESDGNGCAEIMVTPYDLMIHAPDTQPLPVVLRREHLVVRKAELI